MKLGGSRYFRRSVMLAAACILAVVLTACTGRGGGQLPPEAPGSPARRRSASASAARTRGLNPPTGQLKIELTYNDKGSNPLGSSFGIHGIVDKVDPVVESRSASAESASDAGEQLIFLGRYSLTSSAPSGFPSTCPKRETSTTPLCRFEVIVQDNDKSRTPSPGDIFSIKLSNVHVS